MKVVYITPHLSTGGMPEYLKNKIEKIKDDAEIWVLEKNHEKTYNTIRKRIESLIGQDRIITWGEMPQKLLLDKITEIDPDVIHFEEPSEEFVPDYHLDKIYSDERRYSIFETLHDSSYNAKEKIYLPDKFIMVSPWQVNILSDLKVPNEVIEHQLPEGRSRDTNKSRELLGLDPSKKHVVQIGIFTPRKNQKETADLAKNFPDVQFHFIGTLADNYRWYWEPIVRKLPENCKIWGERDDVDLFYQAADLVIFPSIALFNDKETSPLVIKETISWGSPLLLRNLPVYVDMYQESKNIKFMSDKREENIEILKELLSTRVEVSQEDLFRASFNPDDNKISIEYAGTTPIGNVFVSVKDRDSNACIYGFNVEANSQGSGWWCIPIPKQHFDFMGNPNFTGFKIEFYKDRVDSSPIYTHIIDLKKSINKKKIISNGYINFDPVFVNYTQFFVDGIYNNFFAGYRINSAIDVGANVGLFTEWVLDRFGSDTFVLGVEPNSVAAKAFVAMHGERTNVKFSEVALSDTSGDEIEMLINPENTLISSIEGTGSQYTEKQIVKTKTLADLMTEYGLDEVDLLKVDVEGAEYQIFSCLSPEDIRKRFKHLLIEFHNNQGRASELIKKIRSAGYSVDLRDDDTRYSTDENNDRGTIFATRID